MSWKTGFSSKRVVLTVRTVIALALVGPTIFVWAFSTIGTEQSIYQKSISPDGRMTAVFGRQGGGVEPRYYWARIDHGLFGWRHCKIADVEGFEAEHFIRMRWSNSKTVTIEYGLSPGMAGPKYAIGSSRCSQIHGKFSHKADLDAAAFRSNPPRQMIGL